MSAITRPSRAVALDGRGGGNAVAAPGMFTPFRNRIFLAIWIASLVSNFGALIQGVGA